MKHATIVSFLKDLAAMTSPTLPGSARFTRGVGGSFRREKYSEW